MDGESKYIHYRDYIFWAEIQTTSVEGNEDLETSQNTPQPLRTSGT